MKLRLTFKCPEAVSDAIAEKMQAYAERFREAEDDEHRMSEEDLEAPLPQRREDLEDVLFEKEHELQAEAEKWFKYGEYVTVEMDTEAHACTVVKP